MTLIFRGIALVVRDPRCLAQLVVLSKWRLFKDSKNGTTGRRPGRSGEREGSMRARIWICVNYFTELHV